MRDTRRGAATLSPFDVLSFSPSCSTMTSTFSSSGAALVVLFLAHTAFAQPATLVFNDCFTGDASRKMSVDTIYSQTTDLQTLNFTVLGDTAADIVNSNTSLGTVTRHSPRPTHSRLHQPLRSSWILQRSQSVLTVDHISYAMSSLHPRHSLPFPHQTRHIVLYRPGSMASPCPCPSTPKTSSLP